jgi:hypothetical protein
MTTVSASSGMVSRRKAARRSSGSTATKGFAPGSSNRRVAVPVPGPISNVTALGARPHRSHRTSTPSRDRQVVRRDSHLDRPRRLGGRILGRWRTLSFERTRAYAMRWPAATYLEARAVLASGAKIQTITLPGRFTRGYQLVRNISRCCCPGQKPMWILRS